MGLVELRGAFWEGQRDILSLVARWRVKRGESGGQKTTRKKRERKKKMEEMLAEKKKKKEKRNET